MKKALLILFLGILSIASLTAEWNYLETINDPSFYYSHHFTSSVYADGDHAVIGDITAQTEERIEMGAAYLYTDNGTNWIHTGTLWPDEQFTDFGCDVCFTDDFIFVGAPASSEVYVFNWSGNQVQKISSTLPTFGYSICAEDDFLFVGTLEQDGVSIYRHNGTSWVFAATLTDSDPQTIYSGHTLSIDGDYVAFGAYREDPYEGREGLVYVYHWNGSNWEKQEEIGRHSCSEQYGHSVSISGDHLLIGDPSQSETSTYRRNGIGWFPEATLTPEEFYDGNYGYAVSIYGEFAIVGAPTLEVEDIYGAGAAFLFHWDGYNWEYVKKFRADYMEFDAHFASYLCLTRCSAIIGNDPEAGSNLGYFCVFERPVPGTGDASGRPSNDQALSVDVAPLDPYDYDPLSSEMFVVDPDVDVNPNEPNARITVTVVVNPGNEDVQVPENACLTYEVTVTGTNQPVEITLHFLGLNFDPNEIVWNDNGTWTRVTGVSWDLNFDVRTATFTWTFDSPLRDGGEVFVMNNGMDSTLPVELSSFAASVTTSNTVMIEWATQSESDMLGYNLLRGQSDNLDEAILINTNIIDAQNNSTQTAYSFEDADVTVDQTYRYWLQSIEFGGATGFYGPVTCTVIPGGEEPDAPVVEFVTAMEQNHPNPFNPSTDIRFSLQDDAHVKLTVYNTRGQLVKTLLDEERTAGDGHSVTWNGTDENNNSCGSGIYFYKLETGNSTITRKMMMLK